MASSSTRAEPAAILACGISRFHGSGALRVRSLHDVSLTVAPGEVVAVVGPSGSGKTTLLHLLGGLDRADSGSVIVRGVDWQSLSGDERAQFRRRTCGFVVQGFSLLSQATVAENVETPLLLDGVDAVQRQAKVGAALARVGLTGEAGKLPDQLSGGQQQRVAVARAMVMDPSVVLGDEPTGSLDSTTARTVVDLLVSVARERGASVVLVTHDPIVASRADRVLLLRSGRLEDTVSPRAGR
jgi:ABC-type lipoprotein export system ATPase subunit